MPTTLPSKATLYRLCRHAKRQIDDDYRADIEDDVPGIRLTVGANGQGRRSFGWQTGDNSYTGGAYGFPHWAVVDLYRSSNCRDAAADLHEQLLDLIESVA